MMSKLVKRAKEIMRPSPAFKEGDKDAHIILDQMSDKEIKRRYQLELFVRFVSRHALKTCSECHGVGHTGWNDSIHQYQPCQCLQRVIRNEVGKENKLILLSN
jgi:hypothetical protein